MPEAAAPKPEPEEPPAATGSNITKFPHELGLFIANLPPPSVPIGPAPDVDAVIDVSRSLVGSHAAAFGHLRQTLLAW